MSRISGVKQRGIGGTSKMNLRKDFKANFTDVFMKPIGMKSFFWKPYESIFKHITLVPLHFLAGSFATGIKSSSIYHTKKAVYA